VEVRSTVNSVADVTVDHQSSLRRRLTLTAIGLVALLVLLVAAVYLWPLESAGLRSAPVTNFDFAAATNRAQEIVKSDIDNPAVLPECRSTLLSHGAKAAKSVVLLHGYTDCPSQFAQLAQLYFARGYNVWIPRAPHHGLTDTEAHAHVTAAELVTYANDAMNVAAGLGSEAGVAGISGGAVLATWLVAHRPDNVQHCLLLSPFYAPSSAQAPSAAVKPLIVLFGFHLVPDHIDGNGFSFAALSQYLRIARGNSQISRASGHLKSVAIVTSANDTFIDRKKAVSTAQHIADTNNLRLGVRELPADVGLGHDIVDPRELKGRVDELDKLYFQLYEGSQVG
jgi:pimeloyl-ACP methyl ester carboxylesterase